MSGSILAVGFIGITLYCYFVSLHRILWLDEILGWMLVTDPNWHHMLAAWRAGADGGGLGYYITCRMWLALLGQTPLTFRTFSAMGCFAGFAGMWYALRRFYPQQVVALTILLVWFGSHTILGQMIQGRFYGLLIGAAAWALFAAVTSADNASSLTSTLAITAIANTALVEAHTFGAFYCAAILAGSAASDCITGRRRPWFYVAALLPWILLIFSLQAIHSSANVAKPWFWTTRPHIRDLVRMYVPDAFHSALGAGVLLIALGILIARRPPFRPSLDRSALLFPALALVIVPALVWLVSQHGTSYFVDRYLIPFTLGVCVLVTEVLMQAFGTRSSEGKPQLAFACFATLTLAFIGWDALVRYPKEIGSPPYDFTPALTQELPRDIPVVFESLETFAIMQTARPSSSFFVYLLDWPVATAQDSPRGFVSNYHEMATWKEVDYFPSAIQNYEAFFGSTHRFAVVDCNCSQAFDQRVLRRPGWNARKVGEFRRKGDSQSIWIVSDAAKSPSVGYRY